MIIEYFHDNKIYFNNKNKEYNYYQTCIFDITLEIITYFVPD